MSENETPDNLHRMQYSAHLLEEVLGWPSKGNQELIADCLLSLSKSKRISIKQAHGYMERAIKLAKEQCVAIDRFFFTDGVYLQMRPATNGEQRLVLVASPDCKLCGMTGWKFVGNTRRVTRCDCIKTMTVAEAEAQEKRLREVLVHTPSLTSLSEKKAMVSHGKSAAQQKTELASQQRAK